MPSAPTKNLSVGKIDDRNEHLDAAAFREKVLKDDDNVWVVAFISPECPACKAMAPHWDNLVKSSEVAKRPIKFGYVNVDDATR